MHVEGVTFHFHLSAETVQCAAVVSSNCVLMTTVAHHTRTITTSCMAMSGECICQAAWQIHSPDSAMYGWHPYTHIVILRPEAQAE